MRTLTIYLIEVDLASRSLKRGLEEFLLIKSGTAIGRASLLRDR